jgi:hypothetical protein
MSLTDVLCRVEIRECDSWARPERNSLQADALGRDDIRTPNVGYPTESTGTYDCKNSPFDGNRLIARPDTFETSHFEKLMRVVEKWSIVRTLPIDVSIFLLRNEPRLLARLVAERSL